MVLACLLIPTGCVEIVPVLNYAGVYFSSRLSAHPYRLCVHFVPVMNFTGRALLFSPVCSPLQAVCTDCACPKLRRQCIVVLACLLTPTGCVYILCLSWISQAVYCCSDLSAQPYRLCVHFVPVMNFTGSVLLFWPVCSPLQAVCTFCACHEFHRQCIVVLACLLNPTGCVYILCLSWISQAVYCCSGLSAQPYRLCVHFVPVMNFTGHVSLFSPVCSPLQAGETSRLPISVCLKWILRNTEL